LKLKVKYYGVLREIAGKREETVEMPASSTLLGLIRNLAVKYGDSMESYLFDPNLNAPRPIHVYLVNGKTLTSGQTSVAMLSEGSVVSILPTQGG
jgi:molybdopterin converting factor small subunit